MIYIGVDVAKADHCLGGIDAQGKVVRKPVRFDHNAEGFAKLAKLLSAVGSPSEVTIGMEATGHYWVLLAEELQRLGYKPQVFNPILSCDAGRQTVRGRKTDEDDCLIIAKVLRDGHYNPVELPDGDQAKLKKLTRYRQGAVERSANAKKRLVTLLDQVFPEFSALFSDPYCPTARALLAKAPSARRLAQCTGRTFNQMVCRVSQGHLGKERVQLVIAAARSSIAAKRDDPATELAIQMSIAEIDLLEEQIAAYDKEIAPLSIAGKELLVTIPGIGPILAAVILAEIGSISRFVPKPGDQSSADGIHRLLAFAGLDPRVRSSGQWTGKVRMSKRGSAALRTAIWRAAYLARGEDGFSEIYQRHFKTMKQHQKIAISHVARKIVQAIYGVLRYKTAFDLNTFKTGKRVAA